MPRLTADLIQKSSSYLNPLKERELDLRGNKIPVIENLGATQDQYDSIDLSDNEITKIENFPLLNRLRTILLNNNQVSKLANNLGESLPHLDTLILTNNKITNLNDIDPLSELPSLRSLSLLDNLVAKKQNYRLYIIHKLPRLTLLDFRKVKQKERIAAEKLFGPAGKGEKGKDRGDKQEKSVPAHPSGFSHQQVEAIKQAIAQAKSMEEVEELERSLQAGQLPNESKMETN